MPSLGRVAVISLLGISLMLLGMSCGSKKPPEPPSPPQLAVAKDPHGFGQALWVAAGRCDMPTIRRLIEAGADVNIKLGKYLTTPLMEDVQAPDHRCPGQVALTLIQAGARLDDQDIRGYTALHWVADHNCEPAQIELTRLLLQRGADPMIKDKKRQTAFDLAVEDNCTDKMGIIADYMARRLPASAKPGKKPTLPKNTMPASSTMMTPPSAVKTPSTTMTAPPTTMMVPSTTMAAPSTTMTAPSTTMMAPTTTDMAPASMMTPPPTAPLQTEPKPAEKGMPGGYSTGSQWDKTGN